MCGLAGFLDVSRAATEPALRATALAMADAIEHRGPDDREAWADPEAGIALGFRRLAIVDLTPEGRQPMHSACGRFVLVFNGEIYNHAAIRRELAEAPDGGPRYRGHSDTEVMLAAFARWGVEAAVQRFVGMFAFALWDRHDRRLVLGRDRIGEKPLYYGWMGRTFLFGSELKALRAHPDFRGAIDRDALIPYLRRSCIPAPYSIYQGIFKLPPATLLTLDGTRAGPLPDPVPYWSARRVAEAGAEAPFTGTPAEAADALDRLLGDAVGLQMVADVPLGAFLSGGVDSSAIVALMQSRSPAPVKTFTIGFHEAGYNEAEYAKEVAAHLGTEHTELYVTPDETRAVIPKLPTLYDEPFADSSQIPTYLVSELARRHVTVSLSGDGGDELFGGYTRYFQPQRLWYRLGRMPHAVRRTAAGALAALSPRRWDQTFGLVRPVLPNSLKRYATGERTHKFADLIQVAQHQEAVYHCLSSHWYPANRIVLGAHEPRTPLADPAAWAKLDNLPSRLMHLDLITYFPDDILVKVDRASMGVSLESRAPFLDHRVVEFACRLPLAMKVHDGQGKRLLRQVLYRYVPSALIERPKMGFCVPIDSWLRGPLRDWAEALLDEGRLRREGTFDPIPIRRKWREHLEGTANWQHPLWDILMFQAWTEAQ